MSEKSPETEPVSADNGIVRVSGTVTDVFGHRFVVTNDEGRFLADLGPKAGEAIALKPHDTVDIEGEQKPTEIKVTRIAVGGERLQVHHAGPKPKPRNQNKLFGREEAAEMARRDGYELIGELLPHKKHFETLGIKDGRTVALHIHRNGVRVAGLKSGE